MADLTAVVAESRRDAPHQTGASRHAAPAQKFNENHDELGRFSSGDGSGVPAQALKDWTGHRSQGIREALANPNALGWKDTVYQRHGLALAAAVERAPAAAPVLYRGLRFADMQNTPEDAKREFQPGKTVDLNLSSWSTDSSIASVFSGHDEKSSYMLVLDSGAKALNVSDHPGSTEREWVTDGRFRVNSVGPAEGYAKGYAMNMVHLTQEAVFSPPQLAGTKVTKAAWETEERDDHGEWTSGGGGGSLEQDALDTFGVTHDIREAGYMTPSGKLLDFTGRHYATGYRKEGDHFVPDGRGESRHTVPGQGRPIYTATPDYLAGERNVDHREVGQLGLGGGDEGMHALLDAGFVRLSPQSDGSLDAEFSKPLSTSQLGALSRYGRDAPTFGVEVTHGYDSLYYASNDPTVSPGRSVGSMLSEAQAAAVRGADMPAAAKAALLRASRLVLIKSERVPVPGAVPPKPVIRTSGGNRRYDHLAPIIAHTREALIRLAHEAAGWPPPETTKAKPRSPLTFTALAKKAIEQAYQQSYAAGFIDSGLASLLQQAGITPATLGAYGLTMADLTDPSTLDPDVLASAGVDVTDLLGAADDAYEEAADAADQQGSFLGDLAALLIAGGASPALVDAWLGQYAASANPIYELGFAMGVRLQGDIQQATWVTSEDEGVCKLCEERDGQVWGPDEDHPYPGEGTYGDVCEGGQNCRCELQYEMVPAYDIIHLDEADLADLIDRHDLDISDDSYDEYSSAAVPDLTTWTVADLIALRVIAKYSEDQPRVPAGEPGGGEFGSTGDGASWGDAKGAAWLKANEGRYASDPKFAAAADTAVAFTTGGFESIRALSMGETKVGNWDFKDEVNKTGGIAYSDKGFAGHAFQAQLDPTDNSKTLPSQYTMKEGVDALAHMVDTAPKLDGPIFRGMSEYYGVRDGRYSDDPQRPIPKVGDTIDIKGLSSFSRNEKVAEGFASRTIEGAKSSQPDREWVFEVHGAHGIDVAALSPYRQQEVISRGEFKVTDVNVEKTLVRWDYPRDESGNLLPGFRYGEGQTVPVYADHAFQGYGHTRSKDSYPAEKVHVTLEAV